jgi:hypothetical protein
LDEFGKEPYPPTLKIKWKEEYTLAFAVRFGEGSSLIQVSNHGKTCTRGPGPSHCQMRTTRGFKKGIVEVSLLADNCSEGGYGFGIVDQSYPIKSATSYVAENTGFGSDFVLSVFSLSSGYYNNGWVTGSDTYTKYSTGDTVSFVLDLVSRFRFRVLI